MTWNLIQSDKHLIDQAVNIAQHAATSPDLAFMHSILCQIGLPRSRVSGLEFERHCGKAGLSIRAGKLWNGDNFIQQPIPYGVIPRLIMAELNSSAVKTRSPIIDIGDSASAFIRQLGMQSSGGKNGSYTALRKQLQALLACELTLGFTTKTSSVTYSGRPIQQFDLWQTNQQNFWPKKIILSQEYFQSLTTHAVPLDMRALKALSKSSLAMDIYTMLAERLHRIKGGSIMLYWRNLRDQFGLEYTGPNAVKNFRKIFLPTLRRVLAVYPTADVRQVYGGIQLFASPPPIPFKPD